MSRKERVIAAFLLATAVAGAALLPRLLSAPAGRIGVALGPGPGPGPGRSIVEAPAISKARRAASSATPARVAAPSRVAAPVATLARPARPTPVPVKRAGGAATPPPPTPPAPPPPPPPPSPTPPPSPPAAPPPPPPPASPTSTRPGHGYGDGNHTHTGPPGRGSPPGVGQGRRNHGHDLPGSGHGRPVPELPSHTVGTHHRSVGHLAPPPPGTAPPAHDAGPKARPKAGVPSGKGDPPPAVAHGHGH